ncbi:MAG TPA: hypothetical protein VLT62_31160 [Candidatus Methylomirabilis sp.]|nr:hypothetical protein [Candidatus Methylomirabilis sp.]
MPKKAAPKDAKKRTKKPGKIADLPAKSVKAKDAAAVKGGAYDAFLKIEGSTALKIDKAVPTTLTNIADKFVKI